MLSEPLTQKQIQPVLDNLVILVDKQEKSIEHILKYFNDNNIKYRFQPLLSGDYSVLIPKGVIGNSEEISFATGIMIERKGFGGGLSKISQKFGKHRDRFIKEFERFQGKAYIMIEGSNYGDMVKGKYRWELKPSALTGALMTFSIRYDINYIFLPKECADYLYLPEEHRKLQQPEDFHLENVLALWISITQNVGVDKALKKAEQYF